MRRIALINQKGGVGKTTTTVNLGAALAQAGKRVLAIDLDPQANLSLHLDCLPGPDAPSMYSVLTGNCTLREAVRPTRVAGLTLAPSSIDLSGAELEMAAALGRENLLKDALERWIQDCNWAPEADYILLDCPPSLGLLSVNGMVAADEVILTLQTEFFALQGMGKLIEVIGLLRRRLNPGLKIAGILPCLYDARLKLAREVLAEIKLHFPGQVFERPIGKNVKLAEAPSFGQTIFEYAPDSSGALDYRALAEELMAQEKPLAPGPPTLPVAVAHALAAPAAPTPAPAPPTHREGPLELVPAPKTPRKAPRSPRTAVRTPAALEPPAELPD
jgi:chromosome partitioning protein